MPVFKDLSGQKFNKLTVIERGPNIRGNNRWRTTWHCICDCGNKTTVKTCNIKRTKSCGCLNGGKIIHGFSRTSENMIWNTMNQRTRNKNNKNYYRYGGRGITVCERWSKFENFLKDMGPRPKGLSLDRIDNNKGYSPENCRWATSSEQARNTRRNNRITIDGVTKLVTDWFKESPVCIATYYHRKKRGFSDREALGL